MGPMFSMERVSLTNSTKDTCTINHLRKRRNRSGTSIWVTRCVFQTVGDVISEPLPFGMGQFQCTIRQQGRGKGGGGLWFPCRRGGRQDTLVRTLC